jgi:hypothetical protein
MILPSLQDVLAACLPLLMSCLSFNLWLLGERERATTSPATAPKELFATQNICNLRLFNFVAVATMMVKNQPIKRAEPFLGLPFDRLVNP